MFNNILIAGATGRSGQIIVKKLVAKGVRPHVLTRNPVKAESLFGADVIIHQAEISDVNALLQPLQGIEAVISALGTREPVGKNCPKRVDFQGVTNLVKAAQITGVKRFILISSIAVTHPEHPLNRFGRILEWKFKSEEVLRKSGLEYAIVRAGGLTDAPGGSQTLLLGQGDHIRGTLSREDLAELCLQALSYPSPSRVTFEAIAEEKTGLRNWPALFSALYPD